MSNQGLVSFAVRPALLVVVHPTWNALLVQTIILATQFQTSVTYVFRIVLRATQKII